MKKTSNGFALSVVAAAMLTACGGGGNGDSNGTATPLAAADTRSTALAARSALPQAEASVIELVKISETRIGRTEFDYVYRVVVRNGGSKPLTGLSATLKSAGAGTTVVDGIVVVGDLAAGASATPQDTITLRHDRSLPFSTAAFVWSFDGPTVACTTDTSVPLAYEERRLTTPLPFTGNNVTTNDQTPIADRLTQGSGFDGFAPAFAELLCPAAGLTTVTSYDEALAAVRARGQALWRAAVDRVQGRRASPAGATVPQSDDRMLYWARVQMTKVLRQWAPAFAMTDAQREVLQWEFERYSRGQRDINLPQGTAPSGALYRRMVISGFDTFTLGVPGTPNTGLRNGNPSGATALALDGRQFTLSDGSILHIEAYILPVSYDPFNKGMQEDTLAPYFAAGPQRVDASISISQGGANTFNLEQFNARFHGPSAGNDGIVYCPTGNNRLPAYIYPIGTQTSTNPGVLPISMPGSGCDIYPQERWLGYDPLPWMRDNPAQFTFASFPVQMMVTGNTQAGVIRPPGATSQGTEGFNVNWRTSYSYFPNCTQTATSNIANNTAINAMPTTPITQPQPEWCSRSGGGGDYLSNESAYRNTLLRDVYMLDIPAGHIHVPVMTNFYQGTEATGGAQFPRNDNAITDARFEAYRTAIVAQTRNLLLVIGESLRLK